MGRLFSLLWKDCLTVLTSDLQQGPSVAEMMVSLGAEESRQRFHKALLLPEAAG